MFGLFIGAVGLGQVSDILLITKYIRVLVLYVYVPLETLQFMYI